MWPKRGRYVAGVAALVQEATGGTVEIAYVDQGYTAEVPRHPVGVVSLPIARRGFVLLPRRWVVERDVGWKSRFRRLERDQERLPRY